jgi:hypothetical protein
VSERGADQDRPFIQEASLNGLPTVTVQEMELAYPEKDEPGVPRFSGSWRSSLQRRVRLMRKLGESASHELEPQGPIGLQQ